METMETIYKETYFNCSHFWVGLSRIGQDWTEFNRIGQNFTGLERKLEKLNNLDNTAETGVRHQQKSDL